MLKSHCYSVVLLLLVDYIYQDVRFIKSKDDWFQLYSMTVFFSYNPAWYGEGIRLSFIASSHQLLY